MKKKRILTAILSLCMLVSVITAGSVSVSAANIEGGWEFSDNAAVNVTAEEKAVFNKAVEGLDGVGYEAVDVIAAQVVSGMNYAYLCKAAPIVAAPAPYWAVATVNKDVDGNVKLLGIKEIDPAGVKTQENPDEVAPGSWTASYTEGDKAASVPDSVKAALENIDGIALSAEAVLGTQVVAGTNYRILAYGTLQTVSAPMYLYVAEVYQSLEGSASLSNLSVFNLSAYISDAEEESSEEDDSEVSFEEETPSGTWYSDDTAAVNMTEEYKAIFDKVVEGLNDGSYIYEAVDVIAVQTAQVANYAFLCRVTLDVPCHGTTHWEVVTVNKDLDGNIKLLSTAKIDPADVKTKENPGEVAPGAWIASYAEGDKSATLPAAVEAALKNIDGITLSAEAVLGKQLVAGTNYRILAYGTLQTESAYTYLYVADVYEKLDGTAELTSVKAFDLSAYVNTESKDTDTTNTDTSKPVVTPNPVKVPATGNADTVPFAAAAVLLAGAVFACAYGMRKKQR